MTPLTQQQQVESEFGTSPQSLLKDARNHFRNTRGTHINLPGAIECWMSNYRGVTNVRCDIIKRPTGRVVWWFKHQPDEPAVEYVPVPGITPATREEASLAYDDTVEKVKEAIPPHWKVRYGKLGYQEGCYFSAQSADGRSIVVFFAVTNPTEDFVVPKQYEVYLRIYPPTID